MIKTFIAFLGVVAADDTSASLTLKQSPISQISQMRLSDFNKQFILQKPPDGMFEVDIGLFPNQTHDSQSDSSNKKQIPLPDLDG